MIDQVLSHTSDQHPWFKESRSAKTIRGMTGMCGPMPSPTARRPTTGCRYSAAPPGNGIRGACSTTCTIFCASSPTSTCTIRDVQDALLDVARFWLDLGVDGFRLDTVNYYFHDPKLRDNPPNTSQSALEIPLSNPYAWQEHLYDKTQPENLDFLKRLRSLLDEYGEIATVGEVGDGERALRTIAQYTAGRERLHMCYAFEFLSRSFGRAHIEKTIRDFENVAGDGWGCWAFSNHDVERHVSRWAEFGTDDATLGRFCIALLMALRGSVCIYQGEEFGLTEAHVPFELLQDPYGKTFWPEFKGRDGCRTPMVWDTDKPNAGFSSANRTWLPIERVHVPHAALKSGARNSETLIEDYRRYIALRHAHPALIHGSIEFLSSPGEVLVFERSIGGERIVCIFNFGKTDADWQIPGGVKLEALAALSATLTEDKVSLGPNGAVYARRTRDANHG